MLRKEIAVRGTKAKRLRASFREKGIPIEAGEAIPGVQRRVSQGRKLYQRAKKEI